MLIGLVLLLCLATVPLARGRLGALADVRFRVSWLALVAIAGQIVVVSLLPQGNGWLHHAVHLATYGLLRRSAGPLGPGGSLRRPRMAGRRPDDRFRSPRGGIRTRSPSDCV
jgi:hypothetical protein